MARRKRSRALAVLTVPTVSLAGVFAWFADNPFSAAIMGALVGAVIGIALLAFPNLDRGGPADSDGMWQ